MLDRELRYQMPFERLTKLSRSASRKAFSLTWMSTWTLLICYFGLLLLIAVFADGLARVAQELGIPWWSWLALLFAGLIAGLVLQRRSWRRVMKSRVDFDSTVSFREDAGGLRFATSQIEYYIRWNGISQLMLEPDGVVVSHGALFFMIPDSAFADRAARNGFVRDVFDKLSDAARERSERLVRPVLQAASGTARA